MLTKEYILTTGFETAIGSQLPEALFNLPVALGDAEIKGLLDVIDRGHYAEVDATHGEYKMEKELEGLQMKIGKPVLVLRRQIGDMAKFLLNQGQELTGNGFGTLIHEDAMIRYLRIRKDGNNISLRDAYNQARQEMRFIGTSKEYWDASVDSIDASALKVQTTLREFATRPNLFSPRAAQLLTPTTRRNYSNIPTPGLRR